MNKDQKRRDEIMGLDSPKYVGGLEEFDDLTYSQLELLVKEGFVDLKAKCGSSPTVEEFLAFLNKHTEVSAHGYTISGNREDCRLVIRGLTHFGLTQDDLKKDFSALCYNADDLEVVRDSLYSWWA